MQVRPRSAHLTIALERQRQAAASAFCDHISDAEVSLEDEPRGI
jgi:hypothetical protein